MTRAEGEQRREHLQNRIQELEDQLLSVDASSASLSSGGGSKSFTNRSVAEIREKIAYARRELARIEARLGVGRSPDAIVHVVPRYT